MNSTSHLKNKDSNINKIRIKNRKYQYYKLGKGEKRIVFLHGLGSSSAACRYLIEDLLEYYTVYLIDLPGHNGIPYYDINKIEDFSAYIIDFIRHFKLTEFALIGFSFGGVISLKTANVLLNNEKLDIPVVVWASPLCVKNRGTTINADLVLKLGEILPPTGYKKIFSSKVFFNFMKVFKLSDEDILALKEFNNSQLRAVVDVMNTEIPIKKDRALYIFGTADPLVRADIYKKIDVEPDYRIRIANGGHFGTYKGKKEAARRIKEFLDKSM